MPFETLHPEEKAPTESERLYFSQTRCWLLASRLFTLFGGCSAAGSRGELREDPCKGPRARGQAKLMVVAARRNYPVHYFVSVPAGMLAGEAARPVLEAAKEEARATRSCPRDERVGIDVSGLTYPVSSMAERKTYRDDLFGKNLSTVREGRGELWAKLRFEETVLRGDPRAERLFGSPPQVEGGKASALCGESEGSRALDAECRRAGGLALFLARTYTSLLG